VGRGGQERATGEPAPVLDGTCREQNVAHVLAGTAGATSALAAGATGCPASAGAGGIGPAGAACAAHGFACDAGGLGTMSSRRDEPGANTPS
jgi:hypothetical protein